MKTNKNTSKKEIITLKQLEENIFNIHMQDEKGKNCLSEQFVENLTNCIEQLKNEKNANVVILSGLPDVFCAGADFETLSKLTKGDVAPTDIFLSKLLLNIPIPIISAMEGHAVGGGLAIGLCADIAILANESRYGCSFMNMGFTPGMGITKLLEHYMSPAIAHEMQYTGTFMKGRDLQGKTNFNHIIPKTEVFSLSLQIARSIAEKPQTALKTLKRYLGMQRRKMFEETYSIESMMHELSFKQSNILQEIEDNYVRK